MPNLYVFDKDATLVHPRKDGYVESPEDQVLYEGVREKLDRLRAEGHVLAIASNQGGCDWHDVKARSLNVATTFMRRHPEDHLFNKIYTVVNIEPTEDGISSVTASATETVWMNEEWVKKSIEYCFFLADEDPLFVQYKTIEGAIAEMQFAADLCGINEAYFAPTMDGQTVVGLNKARGEWRHQIESPSVGSQYHFGGFRKPQPGMLMMPSYGYKYDRRIMIGDRDSDRESAIAAGFEFVWAEDWRNG